MADREQVTQVTCPEQTPISAPVEVSLNFPVGVLVEFEIVIPAGHAGLTGIGLGYGHAIVLPYGGASFWSGDDDIIRRKYNDKVPGVPWSAFLCNLDLEPHVWEVRFSYNELDTTPPQTPTPTLSANDIVAAGIEAMTGP